MSTYAQGMEAEGRDACGSGPQDRQPGAAERHAPNNRSTPGSAPTGEALTDATPSAEAQPTPKEN